MGCPQCREKFGVEMCVVCTEMARREHVADIVESYVAHLPHGATLPFALHWLFQTLADEGVITKVLKR